jgi:nicotinamidase-related amidase
MVRSKFLKDEKLKPIFYQTLLEEHLHRLGINTVVICGCNFPNCPRKTLYEASERDFKVVLIKDATSVIYDIGIRELENIETRVMNTSDCMSWLRFDIAWILASLEPY